MPNSPTQADFSSLALEYDKFRVGYPPELYDTIRSFGLQPGGKLLDVACGTGLAVEPFAAAGYDVSGVDISQPMLDIAATRIPGATFVRASAEKLPFADGTFEGVTCAQAFHWFNTPQTMMEFMRVTKRGGLVAIWWKRPATDDEVLGIRTAVYNEMGMPELPDGIASGFSAFYSAPFANRNVRVLRFPHFTTVERYLGYERSRMNAIRHFGDRVDEYYTRLGRALVAHFGSREAKFWLAYMIYLYTGTVA